MDLKAPHSLAARRLHTAWHMAKNFQCSCCRGIRPTKRENGHYVGGYIDVHIPRDPILIKLIPPGNVGIFTVCEECARLPEKDVLRKAEQCLIKDYKLLEKAKPLDAPGSHKPKGKSSIMGGDGDGVIVKPE